MQAETHTDDHSPRAVRTRTCIGCGARVDVATADEPMVRLVLGPDNVEIAVDAADHHGGSRGATHRRAGASQEIAGHGAHLHPTAACLSAAATRGCAKAFRRSVTIGGQRLTPALLATEILEAYTRRITGLLRAARRSRALALGSAAATEAMDKGAPLLLVATDAQAAAELGVVRGAIREGRAIAWGTKLGFSEVSGRGEVALLAILDAGIADAVHKAVAVQQACVGASSKTLDKENGRRKKSRRATDGASDVERGA